MANSEALTKQPRQPYQTLAGEEIREPGAYVEIATGTLYRVPPEALSGDAAPFRNRGTAHSQFLRLSKDPFIFLLGARLACVAHNIRPNF